VLWNKVLQADEEFVIHVFLYFLRRQRAAQKIRGGSLANN
jgi:hypothetical protein